MTRIRCLAWSLLSLVLLAGCGSGSGDVPDVETGRFTAQVQGATNTSMAGRAVVRREGGHVSGIELAVDSTRGLSIDIDPHRRPQGTYEVVDWELLGVDRGEAPPGATAFLELPGARFQAVAGTLAVSYASDSEVSGSFVFRMEGRYTRGVADDEPFVSVTGSFRAVQE